MSDGYTILSAAWSSDPEAVILETAEGGAVVVSARDRPDLWAKLMASGVEIAPYGKPRATPLPATSESGPDTVAPAAADPGGPRLKATTFRKGALRGTVYDFATAGAELPAHTHDETSVHISVVARGRVKSCGQGWEQELVAGDVVAFRPGQEHNLVGLEAGSRVVNIRYGGDHD